MTLVILYNFCNACILIKHASAINLNIGFNGELLPDIIGLIFGIWLLLSSTLCALYSGFHLKYPLFV